MIDVYTYWLWLMGSWGAWMHTYWATGSSQYGPDLFCPAGFPAQDDIADLSETPCVIVAAKNECEHRA